MYPRCQQFRAFDENQRALLVGLFKSNATNRSVARALSDHQQNKIVLTKDVQIQRAKLGILRDSKWKMAKPLIELMEEKGFYVRYECNNDDELIRLFFMHKDTIPRFVYLYNHDDINFYII